MEGGDTMTFFFNDTATTEIYTLSLHDALPNFAGLLCGRIDRVQSPVLVAALVLEVDEMRPILRPEVLADAPVGVPRHRLEAAASPIRPDRPDPDVQDAGHGGYVGEALAPGGEAGGKGRGIQPSSC